MVALLVVLASCASAPKLETYTIDMTPSGRVQTDVGLDVVAFVASERLVTSRIVIQESPTRLDTYATARWAAGVGAMVEEKLAAEFGRVGGGEPGMVVSGTVTAFEQVDAPGGALGRVGLDVEIRRAGSNRSEAPLLAKGYAATRAADGDNADAVVRALSRALEDIAAEIAADAAGL
jgi:uncharacterized lipoprotein YmbA